MKQLPHQSIRIRRLFVVMVLIIGCCNTQCQNSTQSNHFSGNSNLKQDQMKLHPLSKEEQYVILNKGTERPFTGEYTDNFKKGTYICKQCHSPLYKSDSKFHSGCGWPSFDDEIKGAVKKTTDADGHRTEITCAACGGHLGHVFYGEGLTDKDTRHCVNSISMLFVEDDNKEIHTRKAIFAGGCFWCTEAIFLQIDGVIEVVSGYIGGVTVNPTYRDICTGTTGHAEAVKIIFDTTKLSFKELLEVFFATHNPTTLNRQGNDVGTQYRSEVFILTKSKNDYS